MTNLVPLRNVDSFFFRKKQNDFSEKKQPKKDDILIIFSHFCPAVPKPIFFKLIINFLIIFLSRQHMTFLRKKKHDHKIVVLKESGFGKK